MSSDITDDYVAHILKRDAERKDTNRFVANGLGSLLNNTRPRNRDAPKPNTRFLKHIVKEADSNNAALLKREAEESRARLRRLKKDSRAESKDRRRSRSPKRERRKDDGRREREVYSARKVHERRTQGTSRIEDERKDSKRRHESSRRDGHKGSRKDRGSPLAQHRREIDEGQGGSSDSDPLDDVIGPKPSSKPAARGRGAHKDSNMDSRFDSKYDPKEDVALDDHVDDDDWDMALEAMRDRAKWKKSGAERLRAAGFTEDEVDKWEKSGKKGRGGDDVDIESVRWQKKGEGREWDRGKVVEGEHVELRPEWGRLKDT
ncbi:hypothetical protein CLAFUW4_14661 [Fulvia fulva]|uniref:Pre-mRNA-splicing factor 38B n=1 Tax=Passalora fulva TaxID=5499 RepID=A0A9Q8PMR6_PASFU|nr:uncharacterized protein CLAFUR5_14489 [Fulvia fulva]KAK4609331.1 hypothetical protein CLAFUR4_14655 [Fulvia fulva]KAK4609709.1 hypothetical protein CLAFUR0_14654 [Fulvia fulva]UJO25323.1 hypothetical protein CLAFUR5_14489 [Fulvia fulva]WPV22638.1 hypothetical protein CLAFUW4_14661 [Fulvia fulva]WPV37741.1 hypothetical protein CLAFUW7_14664 [Fulvia fulva]